MKLRNALCLGIVFGVILSKTVYAQQDEREEMDQALITEFYNKLDDKNYDALVEMCEGAYADALGELVEKGTDFKTGLYNISNVNRVSIISGISTDDYQYRITGFEESYTKLYLIETELSTYVDNGFYYNGINYELIACSNANGEYRIVDIFSPLPNTIQDYVTDDEKINDYFTLRFGESGIMTLMEDAAYNFSQIPAKIKVYRVAYGNGKIEDIDFKTYCKVVMANEFAYDSRPIAYLRAGALCVRNYAWYHYLTASGSLGYHVKDDTSYQKYNPAENISSYPNSCAAVDYIWSVNMSNSRARLFVTQYRSYEGSKGSGILNQNEAYNLAKSGYKYYEILHYYYDNSPVSTERIRINCTKGHTTNSSYSYDSTSHWHECTECGTRVDSIGHNYINSGTYKICRVCGYKTTDIHVSYYRGNEEEY